MGACDDFRVIDEGTVARWIKEIGRGRHAADLSRDDARSLFTAMLNGAVSEVQLGAVLIALRVKGESLDELAGFAEACEARYNHLPAIGDGSIPVVIPSYNGARKLPNLVPLLALLLAREGLPAFIHGVTHDPGRVTTREVLDALGIRPCMSSDEARARLATQHVAFMPIEVLAPEIAGVLAMRQVLGVRNSAHTLAKMLQPFSGQALRIVSVTHPEYLVRVREYFTRHDSGALALRGAEGEAVAHPRREAVVEWLFEGEAQTWTGASVAVDATRAESRHKRPTPDEIDLPDREPHVTARWIERVLDGRLPVPRPIEHQIACCKRALEVIARNARDDTLPRRSL